MGEGKPPHEFASPAMMAAFLKHPKNADISARHNARLALSSTVEAPVQATFLQEAVTKSDEDAVTQIAEDLNG